MRTLNEESYYSKTDETLNIVMKYGTCFTLNEECVDYQIKYILPTRNDNKLAFVLID